MLQSGLLLPFSLFSEDWEGGTDHAFIHMENLREKKIYG